MNTTQTRLRQMIFFLAIAIFLIFIIFLLRYCQASKQMSKSGQDAIRAIPVVTVVVTRADVPVYLSALGSVTPTNSVMVRTQINGRLMRVLFEEGQMVKAGDLLAEIDSRPLQAQLTQFQGQLARDEALLANAQKDVKRYKALYPSGAVAKQTYDTAVSLMKQLEGTVKSDQGQIEAIKVNLIYSRITAPMNGRAGLRLVDPGNFVQTSDANGLVVINTIQPINVIFPIPEDNLPQVMQEMAKGKFLQEMVKGKFLRTEAYDRDKNKLLAEGILRAVDSQIDPSTGTVKLKAEFNNSNFNLFPNQFVNVKLLVEQIPNAIVVPTSAIQRGTQGTFVYLLNQDNTVSVKAVTTSVIAGDNTVITAGILPGQSVVTEGADKLVDGAAVTVTTSHATPSQQLQQQVSMKKSGGAHPLSVK